MKLFSASATGSLGLTLTTSLLLFSHMMDKSEVEAMRMKHLSPRSQYALSQDNTGDDDQTILNVKKDIEVKFEIPPVFTTPKAEEKPKTNTPTTNPAPSNATPANPVAEENKAEVVKSKSFARVKKDQSEEIEGSNSVSTVPDQANV